MCTFWLDPLLCGETLIYFSVDMVYTHVWNFWYIYLHILVDLYFLTNYLLRAFFSNGFSKIINIPKSKRRKIDEKMAKMQIFFSVIFSTLKVQKNGIIWYITVEKDNYALFRNKRFALNEMFQQNASKGEQNFCFLTFLKVTDLSS